MKTDILVTAEQFYPSLLSEGSEENARMSKLGQIFTAGWKERLLLAGKLWSVTVGSVTSGGDVLEVIGGGGGGVVDADLPELGIGVPAGYYLMPISCKASAHGDVSNANADEANMILFADRTSNLDLDTGVFTTYTPLNCLDGAGAFPGSALTTAITTETTAPTFSSMLDYVCFESSQVDGTEAVAAGLRMEYEPKVPVILAGPCAIYLCWGGTTNKSGIATVVVGCVPTSWFPLV